MAKLNMPVLRRNRLSYAEWCMYCQLTYQVQKKQPRYIKSQKGKEIPII